MKLFYHISKSNVAAVNCNFVSKLNYRKWIDCRNYLKLYSKVANVHVRMSRCWMRDLSKRVAWYGEVVCNLAGYGICDSLKRANSRNILGNSYLSIIVQSPKRNRNLEGNWEANMHIKFSDFSRVTYIQKQISGSGKLEFRIPGLRNMTENLAGYRDLWAWYRPLPKDLSNAVN